MFLAGYPTHRQVHSRPVVVVAVVVVVIGRRGVGGGEVGEWARPTKSMSDDNSGCCSQRLG